MRTFRTSYRAERGDNCSRWWKLLVRRLGLELELESGLELELELVRRLGSELELELESMPLVGIAMALNQHCCWRTNSGLSSQACPSSDSREDSHYQGIRLGSVRMVLDHMMHTIRLLRLQQMPALIGIAVALYQHCCWRTNSGLSSQACPSNTQDYSHYQDIRLGSVHTVLDHMMYTVVARFQPAQPFARDPQFSYAHHLN